MAKIYLFDIFEGSFFFLFFSRNPSLPMKNPLTALISQTVSSSAEFRNRARAVDEIEIEQADRCCVVCSFKIRGVDLLNGSGWRKTDYRSRLVLAR